MTRVRIAAGIASVFLAACSEGSNAPLGSTWINGTSAVLPTSTYSVLTTFRRSRMGYAPFAGPIVVGGDLYASTLEGGGHHWGTVYRLTLGGKRTILWHFSKANGIEPRGSLVYSNGQFYGTTFGGGKYNGGTVFSLTVDGKQHVLHDFGSGKDGHAPSAGLVQLHGALYGTTTGGGKYGRGTVFRVTPDGAEAVIHSFSAGSDGGYPIAGLTVDAGTLYGGTLNGGSTGGGVVFEMTPSGRETVLDSLAVCLGSYASGIMGNVVVKRGTVYAASYCGGANHYGAIYSIAASRIVTDIYDFKGQIDGLGPSSPLTLNDATIYGMTDYGGAFGSGTVFAVTLGGTERTLHSFKSGGAGPRGLLLYFRGRLYGAETNGGRYDKGVVFSVQP